MVHRYLWKYSQCCRKQNGIGETQKTNKSHTSGCQKQTVIKIIKVSQLTPAIRPEKRYWKAKKRNLTDKYSCTAKKIRSVNDLVEFMFNNTVAPAEEYTNYDARKAAAIRAEELLGLKLEV